MGKPGRMTEHHTGTGSAAGEASGAAVTPAGFEASRRPARTRRSPARRGEAR